MLIVRGPAILLSPADAAQLHAQLRHAAQRGELHPDLYPLYRNAKELARVFWNRPDHFRPETETGPDVATSDPAASGGSRGMGAREAGALLGISPRRVGQLADELGGRRDARGRWQFDPDRIATEATRRKAG